MPERHRMKPHWLAGLISAVSLALCAQAFAADRGITRQEDPWGRFEEGSWKIVQVTTETITEGRIVSSTTETKSTLERVDDQGVTLRVEVAVEMHGRRFNPQPQTIVQGFHGEPLGDAVRSEDLGPGEVSIQGRTIACRVQQVTSTENASRTVTKIYHSPEVAPYILRRESIKYDAAGAIIGETTMEVVAVDVPCSVLGEVLRTSQIRSVQRHTAGTTIRTAVLSIDVPGGVVCQTVEELDANQQHVRRSRLQLVDFGSAGEDQPDGIFKRRSGRLFRPHLLPFRQ